MTEHPSPIGRGGLNIEQTYDQGIGRDRRALSTERGGYEAEPVENNLPRRRLLCANADCLT
jgi:hypothetical protein